MKIAGSGFVMGQTHTVCQDYAYHEGCLALLSDGCSGSPHTDMGSRMLVHAARGHFRAFGAIDPTSSIILANGMVASMGLPVEALDATLIGVYEDEQAGMLRGVIQGDGHLLARRREDSVWETFTLDHPSNAPYYPSYGASPARDQRYREVYGVETHVTSTVDRVEVKDTCPGRLEVSFPCQKYDMLCGASDGLSDIVDADRNPVPLDVVVGELLTFRVISQGFVERRLRKFVRRQAGKLGWKNNDDISLCLVGDVDE